MLRLTVAAVVNAPIPSAAIACKMAQATLILSGFLHLDRSIRGNFLHEMRRTHGFWYRRILLRHMPGRGLPIRR